MWERRLELAALQRRLSALRARYEATLRKRDELSQQLEAAELNLEIRTAERRVLDLRQAEVERAAAGAVRARDEARENVGRLRSDLGARMASLYRMGRLGYLRTLAAVQSGRMFLRGLQMLAHQARRDAALLSTYEAALADLAGREEALARERRSVSTLAAESRRKEAELAAARAEKAALLARLTRASERERDAVEGLEEKTERLSALLELLESRGKALAPGAASVRRFRGALDWPVRGKVVVPFGRVANPAFPKTFLRSSGWTIEAEPGTQARAVFSGEVVYAQWLKGYGNLVVVDHGDGVFTLYGRLSTGTAPRGQRVALGDRVGTVSTPAEDEPAGLYFEVRDARASVDPRLWLR